MLAVPDFERSSLDISAAAPAPCKTSTTIGISADICSSSTSRRIFSALPSLLSFINLWSACFTLPFSWHRVVNRRPQCICSVSIAATSFQVSSRSLSERSVGLRSLKLVVGVDFVDRVDVDVDVEDVLRVPDSPLEVPLELDSGNDPRRPPTSRGRRYSQSSSMASWQRRHSEPASSISMLQTWYCLSRKRTLSHVSLCSRPSSFKRTWVTTAGVGQVRCIVLINVH